MTLRRHPDIDLVCSRRLHHGRVFDLVHEDLRLPSGLQQSIDVVEHGGAVAVAAVNGSGSLLLVRQYRHALGEWTLEIPAGRLETDELPEAAARRELEEETGHSAAHWELLRPIVPAAGFCSEIIHLFLARDLRAIPGGGRPPDDDEELEVLWMLPREILASEMRDAKTLLAAALLLAGGD